MNNNYLLDTHTALWMLYDSKQLPVEIRKILDNENNILYVSAVSIWETGSKFMKNKGVYVSGSQFYDDLRFNDVYLLPVKAKHIIEYENLKIKENNYINKDPFDRMLVAQAKHEGFTLLTHDSVMKYYDEECIQVF